MYTKPIIFTVIIIVVIVGAICSYQLSTYLNNPNRKKLPQLLAMAKKDSKINDLVGTWKIDNPQWPIKQLTIYADSIGVASKKEKHYLGCSACNSKPIGFVTVPVHDLVFKNTLLAGVLYKFIKDLDYIYKLVLHTNGVVKW